jgi:mono/diheme cytochrome c family protein
MRITVRTSLTGALILAVGYLGFIYSGIYNVAATDPHWGVTRWTMETARMRSIKTHATDIQVPPGLGDPAEIAMGVDHFAAHCAVCHGAPGVPKGDIARGLYPPPPDLAMTAKQFSPAELFWILKHGIKMSGMPAWNDHSDAELWATVAFLQRLPGMSQQDYATLLMASIAHGGHHHADDAAKAPETRP